MKGFTNLASFEIFTFIVLSVTLANPIGNTNSEASNHQLFDRETACIALGTCPGEKPPPSAPSPSPSPPPPPPPPPAPSSTSQTSSVPSPTKDSPVSAQSNIYRYINSCSDDQKKSEQRAWDDAGKLAAAHLKWDPKKSYQAAEDMYLGDKSSNDPWIFGKSWVKVLKPNAQRELNIHNNNAPRSTYAYIYCDEKESKSGLDWCDPNGSQQGQVIAYTWDDLGWFWSNHYVVLCPLFFGLEKSNDLSQQIEAANGRPWKQSVIDNFIDSPGATYFHETYHWGDTVSVPKTNSPAKDHPEVYPPQDVYDLARNKNTDEASLNAESYTLAATAMYIQQVFHLNDPPTPKAVASADIQSQNANISTIKYEARGLDQPPDGWTPPIPNSTFNTQSTDLPKPDPNLWTQVGGPPL